MLVQDRSSPKPPKPPSQSLPFPTHQHSRHFSEAKSLDFSTWFFENIYKIGVVFFLLATVTALFFLRRAGDIAAFLYFQHSQSQAHLPSAIPYPTLPPSSSIPRLVNRSSSYTSFQWERWIVVFVSFYPSDSLHRLTKIKGWQLLAVGNSHTPADWNLKGAIFLSLGMEIEGSLFLRSSHLFISGLRKLGR